MDKVSDHKQRVIAKLVGRAGLRGRIDAKCCECIYDPLAAGTWRRQVELCTSPTCPLYVIRTSSKYQTKEDEAEI